MKILFGTDAWTDYLHWTEADPTLHRRLGKPEPLKGRLSGWWSRHTTAEHRLVYRV